MSYYIPTDLESRPLVVVGAGTLGRRIALMQATDGGEVRLVDISNRVLAEAKTYIESELPGLVSGTNRRMGTLAFTEDLAWALQGAWLVTEAVPEKLELKRDLLADLDRLAPADAILASNSSSYPTSQLVERVSLRERVVNTHTICLPR